MKKRRSISEDIFPILNLFVFSMLLLVMGANFVIMFIGWEGVGLCSYLLIGYWFKKQEYNKAANKAFIMNRIGDLGFPDCYFLDDLKSWVLFLTAMYLQCHSLAKLSLPLLILPALLFIICWRYR